MKNNNNGNTLIVMEVVLIAAGLVGMLLTPSPCEITNSTIIDQNRTHLIIEVTGNGEKEIINYEKNVSLGGLYNVTYTINSVKVK